MQTIAGLLLLLAGASASQTATPVDKVITLLTKLSAQVQEEGAAEAASYDKYACFCKDQADTRVYIIAKSDKKIKSLEAGITAVTGEISSLDEAVTKAKEQITTEEKDQTSNKEARVKEQKVYEDKRKSLVGAVDAVERALATMRSSRDDVDKTMAALMQTEGPALALIAGAMDAKKLQQKPKSYEYGSKEVIATLTSLTVTFKKELEELDKANMNAVGDFEMAYGARANTITALQKESTEKETLSASKSEEKSDMEQSKLEETTAMNADQAYLDDLTAKCEKKAKAWDQRSTMRAGELTALTQGIELLKGMGNLYSTNSKLVGLISKGTQASVAQHKAPVFLQLRKARRQNTYEEKLQEVTAHLNKEAHTLKSAALELLALKLQEAAPDHFVKVRGIINDLIAKLEADAAAEATSKTTCDESMKSAVEKRDKNAAAVETAGAEIDSTTAGIEKLKDEINDLAKQVASLNKDVLEGQELRAEQGARNTKSLADAESGKTTVNAAIEILKKFYGAFLQATPVDRDGNAVSDGAPETFSSDEEYKGKVDSSKGIIGMLEVIAADFERTAGVITADEAEGVKDFNMFKTDAEKAIADKTKLKGTKETELETKKSELTGFEDAKRDAKKMNEQALEELEKLQASCVDNGESYAERAAHRKEEIEALKQALQILEDWK